MSKKFLSGINVTGTATLNTVADAGSNTGKFLVLDASNNVSYRTAAELYADLGIGALPAAYTSTLKHEVKASQTISKGQAVYVSSADGTNMIVSKASNVSEQYSSKTMGLLETSLVANGKGNVITEGLLSGLNTNGANAGDPVWLGVDGALIFGLTNKPVAPAHLVFIGIVTRANANNGEIFVKVQNGFEMNELHNYLEGSVQNNEVIVYESSTSLYKPKTIPAILGYTPADDASVVRITGAQTVSGLKTFGASIIANIGVLLKNNAVSALNGYTAIGGSSSNGIELVFSPGGFTQSLLFQPSAAYSYTFPAATGTVALISDIPSLAGYVPNTRTITINGTTYDLTADRSWTISANQNARTEYEFTTNGSTATYTVTYTVGQVDVFYNGSKLSSGEFTATNGTSVTLAFTPPTGQMVEIVAWETGGGVSNNRTLTINGTTYDLSANRSWTVTDSSKLPLSGGTLTGALGINSTSLTGFSFRNSRNLTGASTTYANYADGQIQADATALSHYFYSESNIAANTAATGIYHFKATQGTFGAGSSLTVQAGLVIDSSLSGAEYNYGIISNIPSAANNFNLYIGGDARNWIASSLGIGAGMSYNATATLDVNGTGRFTNTLTAQSGIIFNTSQTINTTGSIGYNSTQGLFIYTKTGSAYDFKIYNGVGSTFMQVPTGTQNVEFLGTTTINVDNGYLNLNRSAANKYIGIAYRTANAEYWFAGLRETVTNNYIIYNPQSGVDAFTILSSNNNIGIGTTSPSGKLSLGTGIGAKLMIYDNPVTGVYSGLGQDLAAGDSIDLFAHGYGNLGFITFGKLGTNKTTYTEWARFNPSGNFGIGTTISNWGAPFKVIQGGSYGQYVGFQTNVADMKLGVNHYYNSGYIYTTTDKAAQFNISSDSGFQFNTAPSGTAGNTITFTSALSILMNGNVGIGGTPLQALDKTLTNYGSFVSNPTGAAGNYNENLRANRAANGYAAIAMGGANGTSSGTGTGIWTLVCPPAGEAYRFYFDYAGAAVVSFATSGSVTNATGVYGTISDITLKENITDSTPKLENINKLKVRNFNFKGDDLRQIGFIAQEVEQIFPNMVDTDAKGIKSVKTTVLIPMLVKSVQELKAENDELRAILNRNNII